MVFVVFFGNFSAYKGRQIHCNPWPFSQWTLTDFDLMAGIINGIRSIFGHFIASEARQYEASESLAFILIAQIWHLILTNPWHNQWHSYRTFVAFLGNFIAPEAR